MSTAASHHASALKAPEPDLTPEGMLDRARALRPLLRQRQGECEELGRIPDDVNQKLIDAGFYRIIQPRRFGGYEFDVPTFCKVMMEIARGCSETGWVLSLTAGHPLLMSGFPEQGQSEVYGPIGEFRCPAAFNPPGQGVKVDGGYRITGSWVSASGCDISTHFMGMAKVPGAAEGDAPKTIQMLFDRDQVTIIDDWQVIGMRGTGSKSVAVKDVFVPDHRTQETAGSHRGAEAIVRAARLYENPMYSGRIGPFLIAEAVSVVVGAARGALDIYEELLTTKKINFAPFVERYKDPEHQHHYGEALCWISTAEAALIRAAEEYMEYSREQAAGISDFDDLREQRLSLIEQQCVKLSMQAMELIFRTAGTSASAKEGQPIGRFFRNLSVVSTHPALQLDRFALMAARTRFGLKA